MNSTFMILMYVIFIIEAAAFIIITFKEVMNYKKTTKEAKEKDVQKN